MERITTFIRSLSAHELVQLRQDLNNESKFLRHLVDTQLKAIETTNLKVCAHCGADINEIHGHNLTLTFGPHDFRKKATLCGMDCMEGFMERIKTIEQKHHKEQLEKEI